MMDLLTDPLFLLKAWVVLRYVLIAGYFIMCPLLIAARIWAASKGEKWGLVRIDSQYITTYYGSLSARIALLWLVLNHINPPDEWRLAAWLTIPFAIVACILGRCSVRYVHPADLPRK